MSASPFASILSRIQRFTIQGAVDATLPLAMAKAFHAAGHPIVCDPTSTTWWIYDGRDWLRQNDKGMLHLLTILEESGKILHGTIGKFDAKGKSAPDPVPVELTARSQKNVLEKLRSISFCHRPEALEQQVASPWVRWADELIRVENNEIVRRPLGPDVFHLLGFDFPFDGQVGNLEINRFLSQLVAPAPTLAAEDLQAYQAMVTYRTRTILHWIGGTILRRQPMWALGLLGAPGRGKGTLLLALQGLFPAKSRTAFRIDDIAHEYNIGQLIGSAVNIATETAPARVPANCVATLKALVMQESIRGRNIFNDPFFMTPKTAIAFSANTEPTFSTDDAAIFERFCWVDCGESTEQSWRERSDVNPNLVAEIAANIDQLARQAVASYLADKAAGYDPIADPLGRSRREASAANSRSEMLFLEEHMTHKPGEMTPLIEVFEKFNATMKDNGKGQRLSRKQFSDTLIGFGKKVVRSKAAKYRDQSVLMDYVFSDSANYSTASIVGSIEF